MLVLSRKPQEVLHIGGGIEVTVLEVKGNRVKLGIVAPRETSVLRGELVGTDRDDVAGVLPACGQSIPGF
jgi:carbon storage regulator